MAVEGCIFLLFSHLSNHPLSNITENHIENLKTTVFLSYKVSENNRELIRKIMDNLKSEVVIRFSVQDFEDRTMGIQKILHELGSSEIVLIFYSDGYFRSPLCRMESMNAKENEKKMIFIRIHKDFQPQGWLNELVNKNGCIDFTDLDFQTDMGNLIQKIRVIKSSQGLEPSKQILSLIR